MLLVEEALETVDFVFDVLVAGGTEEVLTVGTLVVASNSVSSLKPPGKIMHELTGSAGCWGRTQNR